MQIVVCVKQIYDPEVASALFRVDESKNAVVAVSGMQQVMSPFDEQAVEAALRVREDSAGEVKITVLSLGTGGAREVLKQALSMGADEAVLVPVESADALDSYTTAQVLAKAIGKCGEVDLVLTGRQAADLDAGVVGAGIAELLQWPAINWARKLTVAEGKVTVERVLDDGVDTVETALPALVTVSNELGAPRKPSLRETMRAARKPMAEWPLEELGAAAEAGARQAVERLFVPVKDNQCRFIEGDSPQAMAADLVRALQDAKVL